MLSSGECPICQKAVLERHVKQTPLVLEEEKVQVQNVFVFLLLCLLCLFLLQNTHMRTAIGCVERIQHGQYLHRGVPRATICKQSTGNGVRSHTRTRAKRIREEVRKGAHEAGRRTRGVFEREGEEAGDDESFERFKDETEGNLSKVRASVWPETQVGTDVQRIEKKPQRGRRERNPQAKLLERRVTRSRRWTALVGRRPVRRYSDARFWRKTRKYGQSGSPLLTDALAGTNAIVGLVERLTRRSHDESYGSTSSTGNEYQQNTIFWAKQQQQQHQQQ